MACAKGLKQSMAESNSVYTHFVPEERPVSRITPKVSPARRSTPEARERMNLQMPMPSQRTTILDGIVEREEEGVIVLGPAEGQPSRRVLHVNGYGGRHVWERIKKGILPR